MPMLTARNVFSNSFAASATRADVTEEALGEAVSSRRLHATTDFSELEACDAIIICVPTPLRKTKEPDISYILAAASEIQKRLRRGQLVILESTTYPGTTDEVLLPMFEEGGLKLDEDFLLAFSPERVDPGNPQFHTDNIPKVVGGCTDDSTEVAAALYRVIVKEVHPVTSARVAEAAKLLENTFRAVNIGMANEMARLCYHLGIDTWEVIRAAATKPFGFMAFYPGPGIGGHCIPLDPHYLSWKARQHGFDSRFIGLAEEVNSRMPEHVVQLVADGLNDESKALNRAQGPMIIIAASGMAETGRILHHLANGAGDPRNTVLIVGFQAEHTLGRRIVERRAAIKVFGEEIPLRARVEVLNGYSAHADRTELAAWLDAVRSASPALGRVHLVHGEPEAQGALAASLAAKGYAVDCPAPRTRAPL